MKFKKSIAKSLVFAMALSLAPVTSFVAKAEAKAPSDCKFECTTGLCTATSANYWGIAKEVKGKNPEKKGNLKVGDKWYVVKNIEEYCNKGVDVSSFAKKGVDIALGTETAVSSGTWTIKSIKPGDKSFAVAYLGVASDGAVKKVKVRAGDAIGDDTYGYIGAAITKGASAGSVKLKDDKIQIKVGSGDWIKGSEFIDKYPMQMLTQLGSTLTFRIAGTADQFPSKEVKLKVKAQPKAPNIKYNPKKNELGLKKGDEVCLGNDKWTVASGKCILTELNIDGESDKTIKVRRPAKKNTISSKVQTIVLKKQDKPTLNKVESCTGSVIVNKVEFSLKVPYDLKKGGILENKDKDNAYDVFIGAKAPDAKSKWLSLKAAKAGKGKDVKPSKLTIKYDDKNKKDNTFASGSSVKIYVRIPGSVDKKIGEIKMASAQESCDFKPSVVRQQITCNFKEKCTDGNIISSTKEAITAKAELSMTGIIKNGKAPKIKVTGKVMGVSVKADKFAAGKSILTFKVNKGKKAVTGKFIFTVSYEGATKVVEVTVKDK